MRAARAMAGALLAAAALSLLACGARAPLATTPIHRTAAREDAKLARVLRTSILPMVRREDPLRLVVDLVDQPDWAALDQDISRGAPTRAARRQRAWERLAELDARRADFMAWLSAQPGVSNARAFRCVNRVAFDGNEQVVRALAARPDVLWIWGRLPSSDVEPPETAAPARGQGSAWALDALGAREAWKSGITGRGVVVAVMDSGVALGHPALAGRQAVAVHDANASEDPGRGHGRAVLAAAVGSGIGVAPDARWTAANPLVSGYLDPERLAECIDWLLETGRPDVVVAPWDAPDDGPVEMLAVPLGALRTAGMALVFPAGNFGPQEGVNHRPANLPALGPDAAPALSVGGVSRALEPYQFSCRGPSAEGGGLFPLVSAPAVGLLIADERGGVRIGHGTSFAAGHAAGAIALLMTGHPSLTGPEGERLLLSTATDLGPPGPDPTFGHGLINIPSALSALDRSLPR